MVEQLELFVTYAVRAWVVVPAADRTVVAVGPCSYEVAYEHVERWAQQRPRGGAHYHLRAATAAEVADTRAWETVLRYQRDCDRRMYGGAR